MSKTKKMTFNMIAAAMTKNEPMKLEPFGLPGIELQVKHILSMKEAMAFVKDIVLSCIDMDEMEYTPEAFDFAVRVGILNKYAGIDMPKSLDKAYEVVYDTDLLLEIEGMIDTDQKNSLVAAAEARIAYMRDMQVALAGDKMQKLFNRMDEMMNEGTEILNRAGEIDVAKLEKMADMLQNRDTAENAGSVDRKIIRIPSKSDG